MQSSIVASLLIRFGMVPSFFRQLLNSIGRVRWSGNTRNREIPWFRAPDSIFVPVFERDDHDDIRISDYS